MDIHIEQVRALIADAIDVDEEVLVPDANFVEDIGLDSLSSLEVLVRLEREYGIKIPEEDLTKLVSLNNVVIYLQQRDIADTRETRS